MSGPRRPGGQPKPCPHNTERQCQMCTDDKKRAHYEKNKIAILAKNRAYREKNKAVLAGQKRAYYESNKSAIAVKNKVYREKNKAMLAERDRLKRQKHGARYAATKRAKRQADHGIVFGDLKTSALWAKQKGLCCICRRPLPVRGFATDHDHHKAPGLPNVRGLLHFTCNSGLGKLGEKYGNEALAENLVRAAAYVAPAFNQHDYVWDDCG